MKKLIKYCLIFSGVFPVSSYIHAEPTSGLVSITSIRSYQGPLLSDTASDYRGGVFITVDSNQLCNTNTFRIELKYHGSKEMYSAAMAAMMGSKQVKIEIKHRPEGCEWGHELQSLYIVK